MSEYKEVELDLSNNEILTLALGAHEKNITLNKHINNILEKNIIKNEIKLPEDNLVKMHNLREYARECQMDYIDLENSDIDEKPLVRFSSSKKIKKLAEELKVVFVKFKFEEVLVVASDYPLDKKQIKKLEETCECKIYQLLADKDDIENYKSGE